MELHSPLDVSRSRKSVSQVCEICGTNRTLDRHHVVSRGMGGSKNPEVHSDENLMTLCRQCHRNIHEGGWVLERASGLFGAPKCNGMQRNATHFGAASALLRAIGSIPC